MSHQWHYDVKYLKMTHVWVTRYSRSALHSNNNCNSSRRVLNNRLLQRSSWYVNFLQDFCSVCPPVFLFFFFLSFTLLHPTLSPRLFSLLSISFVCTWNIHSSAPSVSRDDVSLSSCDYYLLTLPTMACSLRWCRDRGRWVKCLLLDPWSLTPLVEKHRNHDNCCTMAQDSRIQHFSVVRMWGGMHH